MLHVAGILISLCLAIVSLFITAVTIIFDTCYFLKMFKQTTGKSAFLQKKNQEKKKQQETQKHQTLVLALQKHLRAYVARRRILSQALTSQDPRPCILLKTPLLSYSRQQLAEFVDKLACEQLPTRLFYLARLLNGNLERADMAQLCLEVLDREGQQLANQLVAQNGFASLLGRLIGMGKGCKVLNLTTEAANRRRVLEKVGEKVLAGAILRQYDTSFVEIEDIYGSKVSESTIEIILEFLSSKNYNFGDVNLPTLASLIGDYLNCISKLSQEQLSSREPLIAYLLLQLAGSGMLKYEQITASLVLENKQMILLIEDEEMLDEMEQKLRQKEEMETYTNEFLNLAKKTTTHPLTLRLFQHPAYSKLKQALLRFVAQLTLVFEDRRLIFVRHLISSDSALSALANSGEAIFYEGLKMKLLGMDDLEFKQWNLFSQAQWGSIISSCLALADAKVQKMVDSNVPLRLVPFKKRASDELELKTVVDLLTDLHKKSLRTKKLNCELFVNQNLSEMLGGFLFGKGARRIQRLLRQLPFIFSFESRFAKFHQSVKSDKSLHDRSLFLMQEVPQELIIAVRRGNQFMDAFQSCMHRDLRRKYKIIFFNEQGLEEEGVDGGGIIKEFINRVLKSSFSEQFGLFLETPLREAFPNPLSPYIHEYEFAGRLVGKAVYEGINIEQKFAEPFLNLLIGRQNTFEDLQFIDPEIYRGLLSLKHSQEDISEMEQTFVIYDQLPNGQNRLVDLLCPSKPPGGKQTLVNNSNKLDFILSYADFKCNKQLQEKTRLFRKGFLKVIKPEWLTMFSNQQLNLIISGAHPDFSVQELSESVVLNEYHEKDETIVALWQTLREFTPQQKALFLLFVTSCSRPPALGFGSMKPLICISKDNNPAHLPTANTCMNVLRLPNYKNKALLRSKLLYAINAKAGFEFA